MKARKLSRAVVEDHAPLEVDADNPHTRLMRTLNYFPTPPWAGRAGGELIRMLDPGAHTILEPACGEGHMAGPLGEAFNIEASDIHPHGYGAVRDFTDPSTWSTTKVQWAATNPPFSKVAEFVELGLQRATHGVALLCRPQILESETRYQLNRRLSFQATFSERVSMQLGSWDPDLSAATAYAWFFWMTPEGEEASPLRDVIAANRAAGGHHSRLIPPGTKVRLWHAEDRRRYAQAKAMPLFDGVDA